MQTKATSSSINLYGIVVDSEVRSMFWVDVEMFLNSATET